MSFISDPNLTPGNTDSTNVLLRKILQRLNGTTCPDSPGQVDSLLWGTTEEGEQIKVRADELSKALIAIPFEHAQVHEGEHFFYTDPVTLGSAGTQDYIFTTPDLVSLRCHMLWQADGTAVTTFQVYEGTARSGSALQTAFNSKRDSLNIAKATVHKGSSAGADGTLIWAYAAGSAQGSSRVPSAAERADEMILKPNTKYLFRVTSGTASNLCNVKFLWYEHDSLA